MRSSNAQPEGTFPSPKMYMKQCFKVSVLKQTAPLFFSAWHCRETWQQHSWLFFSPARPMSLSRKVWNNGMKRGCKSCQHVKNLGSCERLQKASKKCRQRSALLTWNGLWPSVCEAVWNAGWKWSIQYSTVQLCLYSSSTIVAAVTKCLKYI